MSDKDSKFGEQNKNAEERKAVSTPAAEPVKEPTTTENAEVKTDDKAADKK